jgi:hypothetical protein
LTALDQLKSIIYQFTGGISRRTRRQEEIEKEVGEQRSEQ